MMTELRLGQEVEFRNSSSTDVTLICADGGPNIVVRPGEARVVCLRGGKFYRLACWECGLADGSHHTWCPLWRAYEASE